MAGGGATDPGRSSTGDRRLKANAGTAVAAVAALVAMSLVGTSSLGSLLLMTTLAVVAADAVVSIRRTGRVRLTGRVHPTDIVVGDRFALDLDVAGPPVPLRVWVPSWPGDAAVVAEAPATGPLHGRGAVRGVIHEVEVSVESTGLCGLMSCVRAHAVRLPRPLEVGPRPVVPAQPFPELGGGWGEGAVGPAADGELVRGVREYVPGDRLRQVHWRATARAGQLVVKETEEPQAPVLHLVVDLGAGGDAAEAAAGRAAWYAAEALRRGYQVTLTTMEDGLPMTDATPSRVLVNRRLARAGPGTTPRPAGVARGVRVLVVSSGGDEWPS